SYAISVVAKNQSSTGTWARVSAAQKPMNQIHIAIDTEDAINYNSLQLTAPVYPYVIHHQLVTGEMGVDREDFRATLSFTQEKFEAPGVPDKWEETELADSDYRAAIIEFLPMRIRGLPTWISAG